jgi:hypothetical protein
VAMTKQEPLSFTRDVLLWAQTTVASSVRVGPPGTPRSEKQDLLGPPGHANRIRPGIMKRSQWEGAADPRRLGARPNRAGGGVRDQRPPWAAQDGQMSGRVHRPQRADHDDHHSHGSVGDFG